MRKVVLLSCLLTGFLSFGGIHNSANAAPTNAGPPNAFASPSDFHLARAFVRGPGGRRAVVGRRYYGGARYRTGRPFFGSFGGSCWRWTPAGRVWVCGGRPVQTRGPL